MNVIRSKVKCRLLRNSAYDCLTAVLFYWSLHFWLLYLSVLVCFLFVLSFPLLSSSLRLLFWTLNLGWRYETEKGTQIPPIPSFRAPEAVAKNLIKSRCPFCCSCLVSGLACHRHKWWCVVTVVGCGGEPVGLSFWRWVVLRSWLAKLMSLDVGDVLGSRELPSLMDFILGFLASEFHYICWNFPHQSFVYSHQCWCALSSCELPPKMELVSGFRAKFRYFIGISLQDFFFSIEFGTRLWN